MTSPRSRRATRFDADHARITLTDVATGETVGEIRVEAGITSLAYSPHGDVLAVGGHEGGLTFWDPETRHGVRKLKVPGRFRPPWTLPVATPALWGAVCYVVWKRRRAGGNHDH
jgi:WD40 repeat protein